MDVRYTTDPVTYQTMTTAALRSHYVIDSLFAPDEIRMVYSDIDRSIVGSAVPVRQKLRLQAAKAEMAAEYFTERREVGIVNIGGEGAVTADAQTFPLASRDMVYIGRGTKLIEFSSREASHPAQFYFVSYPAHTAYPCKRVGFGEAAMVDLGSLKDANKRTIRKYIQPGTADSCQLVMGLTRLEEGSVWNTMPPHTHQRRSEVYMYFDLSPDAAVFHFMGRPENTRHLVLHDRQAVLSPIWSIHMGVATQSYSFVWAMGGENQLYDDMDPVDVTSIR